MSVSDLLADLHRVIELVRRLEFTATTYRPHAEIY